MLKEQQNVPRGAGLALRGKDPRSGSRQTGIRSRVLKGWGASENEMVCFHFENHFKNEFSTFTPDQDGV